MTSVGRCHKLAIDKYKAGAQKKSLDGDHGVSEIPGGDYGKGKTGNERRGYSIAMMICRVNRGKEPGREIEGKSSEESGT